MKLAATIITVIALLGACASILDGQSAEGGASPSQSTSPYNSHYNSAHWSS
jgi:uncharacterized protein YceK